MDRQGELERREGLRGRNVAIILHCLKECLVEFLIGGAVQEMALGDTVKDGKVGGGILFRSSLSVRDMSAQGSVVTSCSLLWESN